MYLICVQIYTVSNHMRVWRLARVSMTFDVYRVHNVVSREDISSSFSDSIVSVHLPVDPCISATR